jgi:lysophospholipase L1-like esterase
VIWLLRVSLALNALLGVSLARRLRHRVMLRTGRIQAPERDFEALASESFGPSEPGAVALVGDSQVALAPWLDVLTHYSNRGISGAKIADVAAWIDGVLAADPVHLVLLIGSNDVYFGVPLDESVAAARQLLDRIAKRSHCPVTVLSVPPIEVDERAAHRLNDALEKLVLERGFRWLDIVPTLSAMDWTEDGLHLNAAAYRAVAPAVRAVLTGTEN